MTRAARGARSGRGALRVLYLQYTNPAAYPPLLHSAELIARAGGAVRLVGMGRDDDPLGAPPPAGVDVRLFRPPPVPRLTAVHYAAFALWALWQAARFRPRWIYASDPLSCPAARSLRWASRAQLVYHEHDSPADATGRRGVFRRVVERARRSVSRVADVCVLPNARRTAAFAAATGCRDVLTAWNTPLVREVAADAPCRPGLRVVYHGSIVPARLPLAVIDALAKLPDDVTLTAIGYETAGHPDHVERLRARARELGVAHRFERLGPMPRAELMRSGPSFDAGLALLPPDTADANERSMVGASNKPFDYLACGLPVVVPDVDEWRETFVTPGLAIACEPASAADIARALGWLRDHPLDRRDMGRRGQAMIRETWNYERAFAPVLERIVAGAQPAGVLTEPGRA